MRRPFIPTHIPDLDFASDVLRSVADMFHRPLRASGVGERDLWSPACDVYGTEKEVVVRVDLPGVPKENIEVLAVEDAVTISGHVETEREVQEESFVRRERRSGRFSRAVGLPTMVLPDQAKAKFEQGVLEIRIPKAAEAQSAQKVNVD